MSINESWHNINFFSYLVSRSDRYNTSLFDLYVGWINLFAMNINKMPRKLKIFTHGRSLS